VERYALQAPIYRLAQAPASLLAVAVADIRGNPWPGAQVEVQIPGSKTPLIAVTDRDGIAVIEAPDTVGRGVEVHVQAGVYSSWNTWTGAQAASGETLFVVLPVRGPEPLVTLTELAALLAGGAGVAAGYFWKLNALQVGGEVLIGASIFTAIYRHSC
jgi:hypothetical protein